jgi:hypothetical protein
LVMGRLTCSFHLTRRACCKLTSRNISRRLRPIPQAVCRFCGVDQ